MSEDLTDEPGDEELQAALAAQMVQMHPVQVLAQSASMLVNIALARMGALPGAEELRDLATARVAIDSLAGLEQLLAPHVSAEELAAFRGDIAQLRMAFVESSRGEAEPPESPAPPSPEKPKIWTPGGP